MPHKNPDVVKEYMKKYRQEHKERMKELTRNWIENHRDSFKKWQHDYAIQYRAKYPEKCKQLAHARIQKLRTIFQSYFIGKKCSFCNTDKHLVFHHLDPNTKEFGIGDVKNLPEKWDDEVSKCIILCQSCHARYHCLVKYNSLSFIDPLIILQQYPKTTSLERMNKKNHKYMEYRKLFLEKYGQIHFAVGRKDIFTKLWYEEMKIYENDRLFPEKYLIMLVIDEIRKLKSQLKKKDLRDLKKKERCNL